MLNINICMTQTPVETKHIGPDGVLQIYPTTDGGTEVYMEIDTTNKKFKDPKKFNISMGGGSHLDYSMETEEQLTYLTTGGAPLDYHGGGNGFSTRIDVYPDGGMWDNNTNFNWENNHGYLYTKKGIKNGEFTTFIRVHDDVGTDNE